MRKDKLEKSVLSYMNGNDRFAMQIDGGWGIGKTYYIKNMLIPKINLIESHKAIYTSIFGYDNLLDLKKAFYSKIISECLPTPTTIVEGGKRNIQNNIEAITNLAEKLENGLINVGSSIVNTYMEAKTMAKVREIISNDKVVLFIDDLERKSERIDAADLLGFIQADLMDDLGIKIIIISNSEKIRKKFKNDYLEYREKVINKNFKFELEYDQLLDIIVNSQESSSSEEKLNENNFIKNEIHWLGKTIQEVYAINSSDSKIRINLRTVFAALSNYKELEKSILGTGTIIPEHDTDFRKSLFLNTLIITYEYKENKISELSVEDNPVLYSIPYTDIQYIKMESEEGKSKEIWKKYANKNSQLLKYLIFFKSVTQFVMYGYLDLSGEYTRWEGYFFPETIIDPLEKLERFEVCSEEEVREAQRITLDRAVKGEYDLNQMSVLLQQLLKIEEENLLFVEDNFKSKLFDSMANWYKEKGVEDDSPFENLQYFVEEHIDNKELQILFCEFTNIVEKKKKKSLKQYQYERLCSIFNRKKRNRFTKEEDEPYVLIDNSITTNIICHTDILEKYIFVRESKASNLASFLHQNYSLDFRSDEEPSEYLKEEGKKYIEQLDQIGMLIRDMWEKEEKNDETKLDRIDRYNVLKLIETIDILKKNVTYSPSPRLYADEVKFE